MTQGGGGGQPTMKTEEKKEQQNTTEVNKGAVEVTTKTPKQLEKEAKKAEKLAKFQAKLEKKEKATTNTNTNKDNAESLAKEKKKEKPIKKIKESNKEILVYTGDTAPGQRKDTLCPLPDAYSPRYVEAQWYSWWEKEGFFKPEYNQTRKSQSLEGDKFVMVIPPPNVTGTLHLGHALTNAIEDALTRYHRMKGHRTLWVPGCDHAGIATQVVVEKLLWREEQKTRHDLGREAFIEKIWEWRQTKGSRIYEQLKALGSSYDWSRVAFTMDPKLCRAVTEAFVRLHETGNIYRSSRLVNWSCSLRSAISDIEVDKVEINGRTLFSIPGYKEKVEFGVLVKFAYRLEGEGEGGKEEEIIVATTRIETMLGDTAIAVHPDDKRYQHLHGKYVRHPFCDRRLPIVCDEFVDMDFGTGAVKITPAHDPNDYEVGKRCNLPFISILNEDGVIVGDYGEFTGMKRFDCRKLILKRLEELGLYREKVDNAMVVPFCSRSRDVVEPMIKPQWYVSCSEMAEKAAEAVRSGELKIVPEHFTKIWYNWMDGIRDWCVSRQLWWGHRIPAYFVTFKDSTIPSGSSDDETYWIVARSKEEALAKASERFKVNENVIQLHQDEDVLDTWFSSGLFPFSVFGWPENTEDLKMFYPTTLLETGHDILFFWVARMVFFGQKLLGKLPFKEIFLHPMVRDAHGRKMSKSLGNVIDPMDVIHGISLDALHAQLIHSNLDSKEIEKAKLGQRQDYPNGIPECGSDALRFALCAYITQTRDINLDVNRVQGYRFFCNKLWNATKFALLYFGERDDQQQLQRYTSDFQLNPNHQENNMDIWILSRLTASIQLCNNGFQEYDFPAITTAIYNFWLYELCDVYLEHLKPVFATGSEERKSKSRQVLYACLDIGLRLLSPIMPFISEELYQRLPRSNYQEIPSICVSDYPDLMKYNWRNENVEKCVDFVQKTAHIIRSARSDYNIPNKIKTEIYIICRSDDSDSRSILFDYQDTLATLSYCSRVIFDEKPPNTGCAILTIGSECQVYLLLKGLIEADKEITKLMKKKDTLVQMVTKLTQNMEMMDYSIKVPIEVQTNNSEKLKQSEMEIQRIQDAIETLRLM